MVEPFFSNKTNIFVGKSVDNKDSYPLVSIGIPTYNRPDGLKRTLECMLAQTYTNLEIIVSDNASPNPEVEQVAREFASRDARIHYYKQEENNGPAFNFKFVLQQAHGEYFMWAADDDLWESFYLAELVNCLEMLGPQFIAVNFETQYIDEAGNRFEFFAEGVPFYLYQTDNAFERVKHMLQYNYGNLMYSFYKREVLQKDKLIFVENEIPFLFQMVQRGNWRILPKVGFYKRTSCSTYQQARWEKQGGALRHFTILPFSIIKDYFLNVKYSFKYHKLALKNIQYSIETLNLNYRERTSLKILAQKLIWKHFAQLVIGYKGKPF